MSLFEKAFEKSQEGRLENPARSETPAEQQRQPVAQRPALVQPSILGSEDTPSLVVQIDRNAMFLNELVCAESDRQAAAEQYRAIKRDLVRYAESKIQDSAPQQFVMVTSAQPGDGKTFTSVNLALSMTSERDHDVLLIDGDLAKRHITRSLGLSDNAGLLDALRDSKRKFSSVIYSTDVPRLHVLPVGKWSEDATELLSSDRMRQFLNELSARHPKRMVVIDSSPALLLPDARSLSGMVGQIVLVARAGATLQHDVTEAAAQIGGPKRRVVVLLNQVEPSGVLSSILGYRYSYHPYGRSYAEPEQSGTDADNK